MWRKLKKNRWIEWIAALCVVIGIGFFVVYVCKLSSSDYSISGRIEDSDIERTGQIGDFFGGIVGSVWALAGVLLYFSALRMQSKELSNQKEEMVENKRLLSQQQFETTFFNLLKNQQEIKNGIKGSFYAIGRDDYSYKYVNNEYSSNDYFARATNELRAIYELYNRESFEKWDEDLVRSRIREFYDMNHLEPGSDGYGDAEIAKYKEDTRKMYYGLNQDYLSNIYKLSKKIVSLVKQENNEDMKCQCVYTHLYVRHQNEYGHYCRHLYNIVRFIDDERTLCLNDVKSTIERQDETKKIKLRFDRYVDFVHSILSTSELFVLFYNSLIFSKAKDLYVKYGLFNNLQQESLIKPEHVDLIAGATLKSRKDIFGKVIQMIKDANEKRK